MFADKVKELAPKLAIPAACLAAGLLIGRFTTPTKTIETERVVEKLVVDEKYTESKIAEARVQWEKDVSDHTRVETRYVEGKPVVKIEYRDRDTHSSGGSTETIIKTVEIEKIVYRDRLVEKEKIVEGYRPWISVEGIGAFSLTSAWPPVEWGVLGGVRLIGPLWLSAGVMKDSTWRPAAAVRLEF